MLFTLLTSCNEASEDTIGRLLSLCIAHNNVSDKSAVSQCKGSVLITVNASYLAGFICIIYYEIFNEMQVIIL